MAATAIKSEDEKREIFDSPEELERKIDLLATWVRQSNHAIAFTGAGISTSAGVPDFRSGMNTVLKTGPGAWELRAHGAKRPRDAAVKSTLQAIPTATHMALVELQRRNILKYLVTQNTDGLHRRSGFPTGRLSELHGNTNLETCERCQREYMRDFHTRNAGGVFEHYTGRECEACGGRLRDSIINFGESLPQRALQRAFSNGRRADLCLCLGSSLRVTPAADIPVETGLHGGRVVIVNLQRTPLDDSAALVIHGFTDVVMEGLMARLAVPIPPFVLERRCRVEFSSDRTSRPGEITWSVRVGGVDESGAPYSLFRRVDIEPRYAGAGEARAPPMSLLSEPFALQLVTPRVPSLLAIRLHFQGHYGEPSLVVEHAPANGAQDYAMRYNPATGVWAYEQLRAGN